MKHLLIGAAVVALAATSLAAQGNGHGKGQAGGHGNADHGPSMQGPAMHGPPMNSKGKGNSAHAAGSMAPVMRPGSSQHGKGQAHANGNGAAKPHKGANDASRSGHATAARADEARPRNGKRNGPNENAAGGARPGVKVLQDGRRYYSERNARETFDFSTARFGLIDGCPPGLARKNNGCLPPGQARQRLYQPGWWGLSGLAGGSYIYDNGYLMRLSGDGVASYVPLFGGALSPGNIWPSMYAPVAVPEYYVDYYDLGPPGGYRYADNVLYRVDPSTSAITSIAALLTGDNFQIGSPLPPGYDVYNVPYPYRGEYLDGPDARYRYSDGYIYQVDPTTQLVTAAIDLLAG